MGLIAVSKGLLKCESLNSWAFTYILATLDLRKVNGPTRIVKLEIFLASFKRNGCVMELDWNMNFRKPLLNSWLVHFLGWQWPLMSYISLEMDVESDLVPGMPCIADDVQDATQSHISRTRSGRASVEKNKTISLLLLLRYIIFSVSGCLRAKRSFKVRFCARRPELITNGSQTIVR